MLATPSISISHSVLIPPGPLSTQTQNPAIVAPLIANDQLETMADADAQAAAQGGAGARPSMYTPWAWRMLGQQEPERISIHSPILRDDESEALSESKLMSMVAAGIVVAVDDENKVLSPGENFEEWFKNLEKESTSFRLKLDLKSFDKNDLFTKLQRGEYQCHQKSVIDIITNTIARMLQCGVPDICVDGSTGALRLVGFATKLSLISVLCVRSGKH